MDEAAEQQAQVAEIDQLVATTLTSADEADLEAELDMLLGMGESAATKGMFKTVFLII